jgi:hypothetical protein
MQSMSGVNMISGLFDTDANLLEIPYTYSIQFIFSRAL